MFGLKVNYKDLIDGIIRFLIEEKGATVLLIPHVFREPGSDGPSEGDEFVCNGIFDELSPKYGKLIHFVEGKYTTSEMKFVIGSCDLFIGSRMHSCIAALSLNIPAVALSYSDKFRGVMETIEMGELVTDPRTMELPEILRIINTAIMRRDFLSSQLRTTIPLVKEQIYSALELIDTIITRDESPLGK